MGEVLVVNASPLIMLAKVGQLDLLKQTAIEVLVPPAVFQEVLAGPPSDPARLALDRGWENPVPFRETPRTVLEWGLGPGESQVLALAIERAGSAAVLDDAEARMCARSLGVPLLGTLGLIVRAKRMGLIPSASSVIRAMRDAGLFVDDATVERVLREVVGETWQP